MLNESTGLNFGVPGLWPPKYEGVGLTTHACANHTDAQAELCFYNPTLDHLF